MRQVFSRSAAAILLDYCLSHNDIGGVYKRTVKLKKLFTDITVNLNERKRKADDKALLMSSFRYSSESRLERTNYYTQSGDIADNIEQPGQSFN